VVLARVRPRTKEPHHPEPMIRRLELESATKDLNSTKTGGDPYAVGEDATAGTTGPGRYAHRPAVPCPHRWKTSPVPGRPSGAAATAWCTGPRTATPPTAPSPPSPRAGAGTAGAAGTPSTLAPPSLPAREPPSTAERRG